MQPHAHPSEFALSAALVAIADARRAAGEAGLDILALHRRVEVLGHATDWRARATDAYRAGIADLCAELVVLIRRVDAWEIELGDAARAERARLLSVAP